MYAQMSLSEQRRERLASWIVVGVFVLALLLGLAVKTAAEGRTVVHEAEGLRLRYPAGWVKVSTDAPVLLQVEKLASPFRTALTLQRRPIPPEAEKPLSAVQQALTLERARAWTAYRVLSVDDSATVDKRPALHVVFAYVESNPNPFLQTAPVVMLGEDYLFAVGEQVQIVTVTAAEANYSRAQRDFQAFLRSAPK